MRALLGGRLPPEEMFPAGRAGYEVRWLTLPSGLRVRAVRCDPDPQAVTAGATPPVAVFVHGWACSLFTWHRNLRALADEGVQVFAYDLLGHGLSDKPLEDRHYTVPAMAEQLRDVLDALGLDRVLLVGHSMGCAIALRAAIDTPERVAGLALAAPVGFGAVTDMKLLRALTPRPMERVVPYLVPRWTFRVALWRAYGRVGRASSRDVDEYWAPTQDPAFIRACCRLAHTFEWTDGEPAELARVRCPTTLLFGERDHLVHANRCQPFVEHVPQVSWEVVPGAGHTLPEEVPDRMNEAVRRAIREISASDAVAPSVATS